MGRYSQGPKHGLMGRDMESIDGMQFSARMDGVYQEGVKAGFDISIGGMI